MLFIPSQINYKLLYISMLYKNKMLCNYNNIKIFNNNIIYIIK